MSAFDVTILVVIGVVFVALFFILAKLFSDMSTLNREVKEIKMNSTTFLDRLEKKIDEVVAKEFSQFNKELEKLGKIEQSLQKIIKDMEVNAKARTTKSK